MWALRLLIVAGERYRREVADRFDISVTESLVVSALGRAGEPLPPREIGQQLKVMSGSLTAILDRLEGQRMVQRLPHPTDRRGRLIALTDRGQELVAFSNKMLFRAVNAADTDLDPVALADLFAGVAGQLNAAADLIEAERASTG